MPIDRLLNGSITDDEMRLVTAGQSIEIRMRFWQILKILISDQIWIKWTHDVERVSTSNCISHIDDFGCRGRVLEDDKYLQSKTMKTYQPCIIISGKTPHRNFKIPAFILSKNKSNLMWFDSASSCLVLDFERNVNAFRMVRFDYARVFREQGHAEKTNGSLPFLEKIN